MSSAISILILFVFSFSSSFFVAGIEKVYENNPKDIAIVIPPEDDIDLVLEQKKLNDLLFARGLNPNISSVRKSAGYWGLENSKYASAMDMKLIEGRFPDLDSSNIELVTAKSSAYKIGDQIPLMHKGGTVGLFATIVGFYEVMDNFTFLGIGEERGKGNGHLVSPGSFDKIISAIPPERITTDFVLDFNQRLDNKTIDIINGLGYQGYQIWSPAIEAASYHQEFGVFTNYLQNITYILLVLTLINSFLLFSFLIKKSQKEQAIRRILGATNKDFALLFSLVFLMIGIIVTLVSVICSFLMTLIVSLTTNIVAHVARYIYLIIPIMILVPLCLILAHFLLSKKNYLQAIKIG